MHSSGSQVRSLCPTSTRVQGLWPSEIRGEGRKGSRAQRWRGAGRQGRLGSEGGWAAGLVTWRPTWAPRLRSFHGFLLKTLMLSL